MLYQRGPGARWHCLILVLGEIVHDKIGGYARRDDLVACVRSAHGERPRTRPASREQPRRRVFHHETCRIEKRASAPRHPLPQPRARAHGGGGVVRTVLRVYSEARGAGDVCIRLWLAALDVVGGHVARCGGLYAGARECLRGIDVRGWNDCFSKISGVFPVADFGGLAGIECERRRFTVRAGGYDGPSAGRRRTAPFEL